MIKVFVQHRKTFLIQKGKKMYKQSSRSYQTSNTEAVMNMLHFDDRLITSFTLSNICDSRKTNQTYFSFFCFWLVISFFWIIFLVGSGGIGIMNKALKIINKALIDTRIERRNNNFILWASFANNLKDISILK